MSENMTLTGILRANIEHWHSQLEKASHDVAKLEKQSATSFDRIARFGKAAAVAVVASATAIGTVAVHEAMAQEKATARLRQAVENAGASWEAYEEKIEHVSKAGIRLGFDNTKTADALALLTQATRNPQRALDLLSVTMNLARARHMDLAAAANLVGKVSQGNTMVLQRLGISLETTGGKAIQVKKAQEDLAKAQQHLRDVTEAASKGYVTGISARNQYRDAVRSVEDAEKRLTSQQTATKDAIEQLTARFGGNASSYAKTFAGRLEVMKARAQDLLESIGFKLIPVIDRLISATSRAWHWFERHSAISKTLAITIGVVLVGAIGAYISKVTAAAVATTTRWVTAMVVSKTATLGFGQSLEKAGADAATGAQGLSMFMTKLPTLLAFAAAVKTGIAGMQMVQAKAQAEEAKAREYNTQSILKNHIYINKHLIPAYQAGRINIDFMRKELKYLGDMGDVTGQRLVAAAMYAKQGWGNTGAAMTNMISTLVNATKDAAQKGLEAKANGLDGGGATLPMPGFDDGAKQRIKDKVDGILQVAKDKIADFQQRVTEFARSIQQGMGGRDLVSSMMGLSDSSGKHANATPDHVRAYFANKITRARRFAAVLTSLARRRLSRTLLSELAEAGPDALEFAETLSHMDMGFLNRSQGAIDSLATSTANTVAGIAFAGEKKQVAQDITNINLHIAGSVVAEKELAAKIRDLLIQFGRKNVNVSLG